MNDSSPSDAVVRALKRLTVAIWVLIAITTLELLFGLFVTLFPAAVARHFAAQSSDFSSAPPIDQNRDFYNWPLEKQIGAASVIAVGKMKLEDNIYKCIIAEILKQSPNTTFYYKVGDEYRQGNHAAKPGNDYGDGQLLFFVGSPAEFRYSVSFSGDRVTALGDMPLDVLRQMIHKQNASEPKTPHG